MILSALLLGLLLPARGVVADVLDVARTAAIVLLFFLYGARMATGEVWAGLRSWRLQGSMLAATYVAFPVLGLLVQLLPDAVVSPELKTGLLYLSLLPSTVQASVVFTSVARGNVAGAITGATISNVVGIVLTPLLVGVLMVRTSGEAGGNLGGILLQLLLPFAAGQLLQRWLGPVVARARRTLTRVTDRSVIVLVAYTSVSQATVSGAWSHVTWVAAGDPRRRVRGDARDDARCSPGTAAAGWGSRAATASRSSCAGRRRAWRRACRWRPSCSRRRSPRAWRCP